MRSHSKVIQAFFNTTTDKKENANLFVLGIPWDASSSYRKGSATAPDYIRKATSGQLYNSITELGTNLTEVWQIFDCGDVEIVSQNAIDARNTTYKSLKAVYRPNVPFLVLGGDHLITYFSLWSLTELSGKNVGIIYVDAHPDLYENYEGDKYSHACVLRRLIEENKINPEHIVQVGIRAPTPAQLIFAKDNGIEIMSTKEFQSYEPSKRAEMIKRNLSDQVDVIYLSIDLDALDPAYAPGVGNPQPGGLTTREIINFIHELQGLKIFAADVVELCPPYDHSGITSFAAAKLIQEILGIMYKR